jgi:hypothetical protein
VDQSACTTQRVCVFQHSWVYSSSVLHLGGWYQKGNTDLLLGRRCSRLLTSRIRSVLYGTRHQDTFHNLSHLEHRKLWLYFSI